MKKEEVLSVLKDAGRPMRPAEIAKIAELESLDVSKFIKELKLEYGK